jgi:hypothetical protein
MRNCLLLLFLAIVVLAPPAAAGGRNGVYVETGLVAGGALGVESPAHSTLRAVSDIGYIWGRYPAPDGGRWGGGATLYLSLGGEDLRIGVKSRLRYSFRPNWSFDVSAGYIFATLENEPNVSDTGFAGGLHLNYRSWLTVRADVNVKKVGGWTTVHHNQPVLNQPVLHEGGYETAVYGGLALRNRSGWVATAVGVGALLALMWVVVASGGAS